MLSARMTRTAAFTALRRAAAQAPDPLVARTAPVGMLGTLHRDEPRMAALRTPCISSVLASTPALRGPLGSCMAGMPFCSSMAIPIQMRGYHRRARSSRRQIGGWEDLDWRDKAKAGALVVAGVGALVAVTSVGFGVIVFGAAGYGFYTLYRRFVAPYMSGGSTPRSPFGSINADIDRMMRQARTGRPASWFEGEDTTDSRTANRDAQHRRKADVDALVQGLPFMVRGIVKTMFSFVGRAMKDSMQRAGELRRLTLEHVQANGRLGPSVDVSPPHSWQEFAVNGVGRVEAAFPVLINGVAQGEVTAKASVGTGGELAVKDLKYTNLRTGEVVDLLRDAPTGPRKRVVEAEFVERNDRY